MKMISLFWSSLVCLVVFCLLCSVDGYTIKIAAHGQECFHTKPLTRGDSFSVRFQVMTPNGAIDLAIRTPAGRPFFDIGRRTEGAYTLQASHEHGPYLVCFKNQGALEGEKSVKFTIDELSTSEEKPTLPPGPAPVDVAEQENVRVIEIAVQELAAQVRAVQQEQEYFKARERVHRDTTESTNERVMYYAIGEIVLLILITVYQIYSLVRFFEVKKSY